MNWVHERGRQKHKPTLKFYICTHSNDGEILAFGFHSLSKNKSNVLGSKGQRRAQTAWGDGSQKMMFTRVKGGCPGKLIEENCLL
jgi:hypothetical protein